MSVKDNYEYFLSNFNPEANLLKCVEELNELQRECLNYLTKNKEGKFNLENLAGEVADVTIQLELIKRQFRLSKKVAKLIPIKLEKGRKNSILYGFPPLNFNSLNEKDNNSGV